MSMMVSFVLSFFPRDVLDEILNLIESVSEDFPSYFYSVTFASIVPSNDFSEPVRFIYYACDVVVSVISLRLMSRSMSSFMQII